MQVSTPLKESDRSLVLEKDASGPREVWTPILLLVVPVMSSLLYTKRQWTGSVVPLRKEIVI